MRQDLTRGPGAGLLCPGLRPGVGAGPSAHGYLHSAPPGPVSGGGGGIPAH